LAVNPIPWVTTAMLIECDISPLVPVTDTVVSGHGRRHD